MVAKITSPHSIRRALNYNEHKVKDHLAVCIYARNFPYEVERLSFYQKLGRFQDLISLNDRARKSNTLHISLNFDPSEKIGKEKLISIAECYMEKIGFGTQPYLVYKHFDAGHPHVHILTTNIEASGKRINTYNIGRLKSEYARKEVETEFNLVKAQEGKVRQNEEIRLSKVMYGKSEAKRSITNVLDKVVNQYNFNSLASLNAILRTFNVTADIGKEGGRIKKHGGLLYHILDQNGKKAGVPIKASSIYNKPTLEYLKGVIERNKLHRSVGRKKLRDTINLEIQKGPKDLAGLINGLGNYNIETIFHRNETGFLFGITFIDHLNKCVFNGSELGKNYSVSALERHFGCETPSGLNLKEFKLEFISKPILNEKIIKQGRVAEDLNLVVSKGLLNDILKTEDNDTRLLYPLMVKKRKKRRRQKL